MCISVAWTPFTLPSIWWLCVARFILGIAVQVQMGNPLINDYVHESTRGKATVWQQSGYILGELFAMAILFNFTKTYDPRISFAIASIVILVIGMYFTSQVVEINQNQINSEKNLEFDFENKNTQSDNFQEINRRMKEVIFSDIGYVVAFFGAF